MACIAGDKLSAPEIRLIDGFHHRHHLARDLLHRFFVLIERAFNVAERAVHTRLAFDQVHRLIDVAGRDAPQHLDVPVDLFGLSFLQVWTTGLLAAPLLRATLLATAWLSTATLCPCERAHNENSCHNG